jgi:hypothetical protein
MGPEFPKEMFPAIILSVGGSHTSVEQNGILCDPRSAFRIRVKAPAPVMKIHVEVRIDGFSESSPCDAVLEEANRSYIIAPTPRWDMRKLAFTDQPYATDGCRELNGKWGLARGTNGTLRDSNG